MSRPPGNSTQDGFSGLGHRNGAATTSVATVAQRSRATSDSAGSFLPDRRIGVFGHVRTIRPATRPAVSATRQSGQNDRITIAW